MQTSVREWKKTGTGISIPAYVGSPCDALYLAVRIIHHTCCYCGEPSENAEHVIPKHLKIFDIPLNLVGACEFCNKRKGNRMLNSKFFQKAFGEARDGEQSVIALSNYIYARAHKTMDGFDRFFDSAEKQKPDFQKFVQRLSLAA